MPLDGDADHVETPPLWHEGPEAHNPPSGIVGGQPAWAAQNLSAAARIASMRGNCLPLR